VDNGCYEKCENKAVHVNWQYSLVDYLEKSQVTTRRTRRSQGGRLGTQE
jgi:hypothetical protein